MSVSVSNKLTEQHANIIFRLYFKLSSEEKIFYFLHSENRIDTHIYTKQNILFFYKLRKVKSFILLSL